jgi:hypothetical protein
MGEKYTRSAKGESRRPRGIVASTSSERYINGAAEAPLRLMGIDSPIARARLSPFVVSERSSEEHVSLHHRSPAEVIGRFADAASRRNGRRDEGGDRSRFLNRSQTRARDAAWPH